MTFTGYLSFTSNEFKFDDGFNVTLNVAADGLVSDVYMNKYDVLSGGDFTLNYILGNTNKELEFKDFEIKIESDFFTDSFTHGIILPNTPSNTIYSRKISAPIIKEDKNYDIVVFTKYLTEGNEEKEYNNTVTLAVTGSGEILKLSQAVTPGGIINPGDEITVEVTVENLKDDYFKNVRVHEEFSRGGVVSFGDSLKTVDLASSESKKVYLYKIKLPEKYFYDTFNITSSALIPDIGYKKEFTNVIQVNPTPIEEIEGHIEKTNEEVLENPNVNVQYNSQDGKATNRQSFFSKVFKSIESFFAGIFG